MRRPAPPATNHSSPLRHLAVLALLVGPSPLAIAHSRPDGATHHTFQFESAGFHAVIADVNRPDLTPTAAYSPRLANIWRIISQSQPLVAITGTFFAWENQQPVADVLIDGELKAQGHRGSILAVDWFGKPAILDAPVRQSFDYSPYRYALRGMVRILRDGNVQPNPRAQGFRDPRIWGRAPRTAVGVTPNGRLVFVATSQSVTLSHLGNALRSQGAVDAVSLDGGGSAMLYFNGNVKVSTNRPLSTLFMVERRSPFDHVFDQRLRALGQNKAQNALLAALDPRP